MRLDRQLARFLAAVIVMIAAYFAPSAVQAHAGHHHAAPAVVTAPEAVLIADGSAASSQSAASATLPTLPATAVVTAADADETGPSQRCTGPCCCNTSMACCGLHALTADAGSGVRLGPAMRLIGVPDDLARPGVDPEALPKPPRTFA
jgi:hypothetical protein